MEALNLPEGMALYPYLTTPDSGPKGTPYASPIWKLNVITVTPADSPAVAKTIEKLEAIRDAFFEETRQELLSSPKTKSRAAALKKTDITKPHFDKESGEPTGEVVFTCKRLSEVNDKKTGGKRRQSPPTVYGPNGKVLPEGVDVWTGSRVVVHVFPKPYYLVKESTVGVTLYFDAVLVKKLNTGGSSLAGRSAASVFGNDAIDADAEDIEAPGGATPAGDDDDLDMTTPSDGKTNGDY